MSIALRYAARSDVGLVRTKNEDSGYAGPHLLVVADGMGGHAGGDVASSLAVGTLADLDGEALGSTEAQTRLAERLRQTNTAPAGPGPRAARARGHGHHRDGAAADRLAHRARPHRRLAGLPAARTATWSR